MPQLLRLRYTHDVQQADSQSFETWESSQWVEYGEVDHKFLGTFDLFFGMAGDIAEP